MAVNSQMGELPKCKSVENFITGSSCKSVLGIKDSGFIGGVIGIPRSYDLYTL